MKAYRCFKLLPAMALAIAVMGLAGTAAAQLPPVWDGTADVSWYTGPDGQNYNIMTAEHLAGLASLVNGGNTFEGKTVTLLANIFLNDTAGMGTANFDPAGKRPWTPIGIYSATTSQQRPFRGEFAGAAGAVNRKIYGLYIPDGAAGQGLFGYATGAINDIDVLYGKVTGTNYVGGVAGYGGSFDNVSSDIAVSGTNYVGGVAGAAGGSINRVTARVDITGGSDYVGGLIGWTSSGGNITSSHHIGNVSGRDRVGGLAGYCNSPAITGAANDTGYTTFSRGNVSGRYYVGGLIGSVSASTDSVVNVYSLGGVSGTSYVGGLVGQGSPGYIKNAYSQGKIEGTGGYVGGLAGIMAGGDITSSYHTGGDVSGDSAVGGLAGAAYKSSGYLDQRYTVDITSSRHTGGNVSGNTFVGGLVGDGEVNIISSHSTGDIRGTDYVGGLAGVIRQDAKFGNVGYEYNNSKSKIISSHSIGDIRGTDYVGGLAGACGTRVITGVAGDTGHTTFSKGNVSGRKYVGGLIGYCQHGSSSIEDSIVNVYSLGDVSGKSYIGGLAGYIRASGLSYIKNAYSQGNVWGDSVYVGGLAGYMLDVYAIRSSNHTGGDVRGTDYVGGLAGYSDSRIIAGAAGDTGYTTFSRGNVSGRNYVGGLIGYAEHNSYASNPDSIVNAYSLGDVSGKSNVGGLAGYIRGYNLANSRNIKNAYSQGNVHGDSVNVGGLAGYIDYGDITSSSHTGGSVSGTDRVGGLAGYANGAVSGSYSAGGVTGRDTVGGLAGYSWGGITNSYSLSPVNARNTAGGLAGYSAGNITGSHSSGGVKGIYQVGGLAGNRGSGTIDNCYSTSDVTGDDNVGGLVGSSRGTIQNSYASGNVTGDAENSSAGNDNLGGLVGYAYNGNILRSYALGNVTGTARLGGLVGRTDGVTITDAYARGNVTASFYLEDIGNVYAGGLAGFTGGTCVFTNTYSAGAVSAAALAGGLVGSPTGTFTITGSYFDKTASGQTQGIGGGSPALAGNTAAEMKSAATFTGWDWAAVWAIDEGGSYPFFQWQNKFVQLADVVTEDLTGLVYTGNPIEPQVLSVSLGGAAVPTYTVEYQNNINAGAAQIIITGTGQYYGKKIIPFEIKGPMPATYLVTFSAGENGSLAAAVDGSAITTGAEVEHGKSVVFTASPASSYGVSGWTLNGAAVAGNTSTTYTLAGVSAASAVSVSFGRSTSVSAADRVIPPQLNEEASVIAPMVILAGEFTAGPNPVSRSSGEVKFYRQGRRVSNSELRIYDATGNVVNKVKITDNALNNQSRRVVGSWDLTDKKGRQASEGTYLVKGVLKTPDGKSEKVSVILGVR